MYIINYSYPELCVIGAINCHVKSTSKFFSQLRQIQHIRTLKIYYETARTMTNIHYPLLIMKGTDSAPSQQMWVS